MPLFLTFKTSNVTGPLILSLGLTLVGLTTLRLLGLVLLEPVLQFNGFSLVNTSGSRLRPSTLALGRRRILPLNVLFGLNGKVEQVVEGLLLLALHLSGDAILQTVHELCHKCLLSLTRLEFVSERLKFLIVLLYCSGSLR